MRGVQATPYRVGEHEVAAFRRDGHVVLRGLLADADLGHYRPAIERVVAAGLDAVATTGTTEANGAFSVQSQNLWTVDPEIGEFCTSARFAQVAAALLGIDGVRLYHDQALFKAPGANRSPWHQDHFFFPLAGPTITMWMPLVDVTPEMGVMSFFSGSHRLGCLGPSEFDAASEAQLQAEATGRGLRIASHGAMAAGDATFHSGWTLHSAPANTTARTRAVMTVVYVAADAVITEPATPQQAEDLARWMPGQRPGERVGSPLNPLLWCGAPEDAAG